MARGSARDKESTPALARFVEELSTVPRFFIVGWFVGLLAPVAAVAGIVGGIYFFTRKVPFVKGIEEHEHGRRLVIELVEPDEARMLLRKSGEAARAFGDEIRNELEGETEQ
jgi:hypothetical protein